MSDMMQHQSVIYHTNSILECQIVSLVTILTLQRSLNHIEDEEHDSGS